MPLAGPLFNVQVSETQILIHFSQGKIRCALRTTQRSSSSPDAVHTCKGAFLHISAHRNPTSAYPCYHSPAQVHKLLIFPSSAFFSFHQSRIIIQISSLCFFPTTKVFFLIAFLLTYFLLNTLNTSLFSNSVKTNEKKKLVHLKLSISSDSHLHPQDLIQFLAHSRC